MKRMQDSALFKILGHPERFAILKPYGHSAAHWEKLQKTPAHIRHHLRSQRAGLVECSSPVRCRVARKFAPQRALFIHGRAA
jgi:hypothetical protein